VEASIANSVAPDAGVTDKIEYIMAVCEGHVPDGSAAFGAAGFVTPLHWPLQSADSMPATAKTADAAVVSATE
jgi:hypothetical protein